MSQSIIRNLGEELPVFCEKCGYSLHGATQVRCEQCDILQFHCPECGHHQPINTLRPAFQLMLGRIRGMVLAASVTARIIFFVITLFAWTGMGSAWAYSFTYRTRAGVVDYELNRIDPEMIAAFSIYGACFGMVGRMLLLRWRRGYVIGFVLGVLVFAAICVGAWMEYATRRNRPLPFTADLMTGAAIGVLSVIGASTLVWAIWTLLVRAFLPAQTARRLLEWQRSLSAIPSDRAASSLAREPIAS